MSNAHLSFAFFCVRFRQAELSISFSEWQDYGGPNKDGEELHPISPDLPGDPEFAGHTSHYMSLLVIDAVKKSVV